ncbi:MAG: glycosyltransferase family 2 protein [Humidesulfovibrio sp.]|nr:glycosyltransferase family 2 protein [Humidesulfovibrio sp.]
MEQRQNYTAAHLPATLSVVFSFRNEQSVLAELLRQTEEVLNGELRAGVLSCYELIFVNDDSTDGSLALLEEHARANSHVRIITMSRRFGVSPCVMAGMAHSTGDAVVYMDADLQDPPQVIPELLRAWRSDVRPDVVHTVRLSRAGESGFKLFLTRLGYKLLHSITSVQLPVESGDFKLLSRRVVQHLVQFPEKQPFMRGLICWIGFRQVFVPYHRAARAAGDTKFPVLSLSVLGNFFQSALISFSSAPLHIASLGGFLSILVGMFVLVHVLYEKFSGKYVPGWTSLMVLVLFMGSIQLFCQGIFGLYLKSIFDEIKKRPNYIIESRHGFAEDRPDGQTAKDTRNRTGDAPSGPISEGRSKGRRGLRGSPGSRKTGDRTRRYLGKGR